MVCHQRVAGLGDLHLTAEATLVRFSDAGTLDSHALGLLWEPTDRLQFTAQLEIHGQELTFAPLEEVADIALEGILADQFWIYLPSDRSRGTIEARAAAMADARDPEYLVAPSPWNVPKK